MLRFRLRCTTWITGRSRGLLLGSSVLLAFGILNNPREGIAESRLAAVQVSFEAIPEQIRARNQHAKGAALLRESIATERGSLARSYLPTLQAHLGHESAKTGSSDTASDPVYGVEVRVNVYNGGRDTLHDQMVESSARKASIDAEQVFREEVRKARRAFWRAIAQREMEGYIRSARKENVQQLRAAQERIGAGLAPSTDELEFEMHNVELEQEQARIELEREAVERELRVLLGVEVDVPLTLPAAVEHDHHDALIQEAFRAEDRLDLRSIGEAEQQTELERQVIERWWVPSLELFAGYELYPFRERESFERSEREEGVVGAKVQINLFDGFRSRTQAQKQTLAAAGLRANRAQTEAEVRADFENAQARLRLTHELIHRSEAVLTLATRYLAQTLDEYQRGVKNSPDVLAALERLVNLQRRFLELRLDYQLARVELLAALGR